MKRLTLDQLLTLEKLTNKEYYLNGSPRIRPRTDIENTKLNIPQEHCELMSEGVKSYKLKKLLYKIKSKSNSPK